MTIRKIFFSGGGTAGHVIPCFPLIQAALKKNFEVHFIGTHSGFEEKLVKEEFKDVIFHGISTGKLRRSMSTSNFVMPFKVLKGVIESILILRRYRPEMLFSKGGFVALPPTIAAFFLGIPVSLHESDWSFGLANKIASFFARYIFVSLQGDSWINKIFEKKIQIVAPLIRTFFYAKDFHEELKKNSFKISGASEFSNTLKTILIYGGSQGSAFLNDMIYSNLEILTTKYNVVHICGTGKAPSKSLQEQYADNYKVFEFLGVELQYYQLMADLIISRAGMNAIWEGVFLEKPQILVPLSTKASRGDQIENAEYFQKAGVVKVLQEQELDLLTLESLIEEIFENFKEIEEKILELKKAVSFVKLEDRLFELMEMQIQD